jgi:hypothetical protein
VTNPARNERASIPAGYSQASHIQVSHIRVSRNQYMARMTRYESLEHSGSDTLNPHKRPFCGHALSLPAFSLGRGGCCLLLAGRPPIPVRLSAVLADGEGQRVAAVGAQGPAARIAGADGAADAELADQGCRTVRAGQLSQSSVETRP